MAKAEIRTITEVVSAGQIPVIRAREAGFADAFKELESDIRDMRRAAELAARQLDSVISYPVDMYDLVELADYAVNHAHEVAMRLEARWDELHNRACEAGSIAAAA